MRMIVTSFLVLAALVSACVPMDGAYGPYGPSAYGSSYVSGLEDPYYAEPRPDAYDRSAAGCLRYKRFCPEVLYYSDTNPETERRLSAVERKVDRQGKQILVLAENDELMEENYRIVVGMMRKNNMTLEQIIGQYRTTCEQFMKNPSVIKDEKYRAKQIKFCTGLENLASGGDAEKLAPLDEPDGAAPSDLQ